VNPATGKDEVCLTRGPLVYCVEDIDTRDVNVDSVAFVDGPVSLGERIEIEPIAQAMQPYWESARYQGLEISVWSESVEIYRR
jgi:hypothetical protein